MSQYANNDHYTDPQTGILKNLLGIIDEAELEKAEATFASLKSFAMLQNPIKGNFDLAHLKTIHHFMFEDLYEWAGQYRDIDIAYHAKLTACIRANIRELGLE